MRRVFTIMILSGLLSCSVGEEELGHLGDLAGRCIVVTTNMSLIRETPESRPFLSADVPRQFKALREFKPGDRFVIVRAVYNTGFEQAVVRILGHPMGQSDGELDLSALFRAKWLFAVGDAHLEGEALGRAGRPELNPDIARWCDENSNRWGSHLRCSVPHA